MALGLSKRHRDFLIKFRFTYMSVIHRYIISSYGPMVRKWWHRVVDSECQAREVYRQRRVRYPWIGCVVYDKTVGCFICDYFPNSN